MPEPPVESLPLPAGHLLGIFEVSKDAQGSLAAITLGFFPSPLHG